MIYERQDQKYRLAEVLILKNKISYWEGEVVSKTSAQNKALSITLFSFSKRKEISTHQSVENALVTCLEGTGKNNHRQKRVSAS